MIPDFNEIETKNISKTIELFTFLKEQWKDESLSDHNIIALIQASYTKDLEQTIKQAAYGQFFEQAMNNHVREKLNERD